MAGRRRTRLRRQRLAPTSLGVRAGGLPEILGFVAGVRRLTYPDGGAMQYLGGMRKPSA